MNNAAKNILRQLNVTEDGDVFLPQDIAAILKELNQNDSEKSYDQRDCSNSII
jgi:hypothetical protein